MKPAPVGVCCQLIGVQLLAVLGLTTAKSTNMPIEDIGLLHSNETVNFQPADSERVMDTNVLYYGHGHCHDKILTKIFLLACLLALKFDLKEVTMPRRRTSYEQDNHHIYRELLGRTSA